MFIVMFIVFNQIKNGRTLTIFKIKEIKMKKYNDVNLYIYKFQIVMFPFYFSFFLKNKKQ